MNRKRPELPEWNPDNTYAYNARRGVFPSDEVEDATGVVSLHQATLVLNYVEVALRLDDAAVKAMRDEVLSELTEHGHIDG